MRRKRPFNRIEQRLQSIPTWLFVSSVVMGLSAIALWANPDGKPKSFRDAVQVIFSSTESIAIDSVLLKMTWTASLNDFGLPSGLAQRAIADRPITTLLTKSQVGIL